MKGAEMYELSGRAECVAMEEDAEINAITNEHLAAQALWNADTLRGLLKRTAVTESMPKCTTDEDS